MKRAIGSKKGYTALAWTSFFKQLGDRLSRPKLGNPTEDYIAVFGASFKLAKSWYQLGDRKVLL